MAGYDFKFACDSITDTLGQTQEYFFWCVICKSMEDSIGRDLNQLRMTTDGFIASNTNINDIARESTTSPTTELWKQIEDFNERANSIVPNLNSPVQITGGSQSNYNSYHETLRGLESSLSPDNLTRLGLSYVDNMSGSSMPQSFLGKSLGPQAICLDQLTSSYEADEFKLFLSISDLLETTGDMSGFIKSLFDAIDGYVSMGCNPTNGLAFEAETNAYINQLPLDSDYKFDMNQIIGGYDISPDMSTNLKTVSDNIGPTIDSAKSRISI